MEKHRSIAPSGIQRRQEKALPTRKKEKPERKKSAQTQNASSKHTSGSLQEKRRILYLKGIFGLGLEKGGVIISLGSKRHSPPPSLKKKQQPFRPRKRKRDQKTPHTPSPPAPPRKKWRRGAQPRPCIPKTSQQIEPFAPTHTLTHQKTPSG